MKKSDSRPTFFYFRIHINKTMKRFTQFILGIALLTTLTLACSSNRNMVLKQNAGVVADPSLYATLYQQFAAEYKALCFQAYNIASFRLDEALQRKYHRPLSIVLDIDETVLDNIPYQAAALKGNFGYPVQWDEWMNKADAAPLEGVVKFLQIAEDKGVTIFYISNRKDKYKAATIENLKAKHLPFADEVHVLLRTDGNEKNTRRNLVAQNFEIIMFVGDNLGDFDGIFDTTDAQLRTDATIKYADSFGEKWIVLPNPVYGNWVDALRGYDLKLPPQALADTLKNSLIEF